MGTSWNFVPSRTGLGGSEVGGASRDRTGDLLHAMQALSQLSYGPTCWRGGILETRPGVVKHS